MIGRIGGALALLFFGCSMLAGEAFPGAPGESLVGKDAPAFEAKDLEGKALGTELARKDGLVVVLNFWGLRCGDCITEMPHLNNLHSRHRGKGVAVWGVNMDGVAPEVIREQSARLPAPPEYPLIPDREFKIIEGYKVEAAPFTFVIAPDGKVAYQHEGYAPGVEKEIEEAVLKLLPKK